MNENVNILNWFEISVSDTARAKKFYETVFGIEMQTSEMMGMKMTMFPSQMMNGKVAGALVEGPMHKPSMDGAKIYLNGNPDLGVALGKVVAAGGSVMMPKTKISDEIGYMAAFVDTEGNGLCMHSGN